jgi:hypothetical protein
MAEEKKKGFISEPVEKKPASKKAKDKEIVTVEGVSEKLTDYEKIKAEIDDLTAIRDMLRDELLGVAKEKYVDLYNKKGERPETFLIKDGDGCVMVITEDKYKKITGEDAQRLTKKYGEGIVDKKTVYAFKPELLEKHWDVIEEAVSNLTIPDEDKKLLIEGTVAYSIKKGAIEKLKSFSEDISAVITDIQPTVQLKNCGKEMGMGGNLTEEEFEAINEVFDDTYEDFLKTQMKGKSFKRGGATLVGNIK